MNGYTNSKTFKDMQDAVSFTENDLKDNYIFEWVFELNVDNTVTVHWNE
jgi:hypothetical protein